MFKKLFKKLNKEEKRFQRIELLYKVYDLMDDDPHLKGIVKDIIKIELEEK